MRDGRPPRKPLAPYGRGVSACERPHGTTGAPLILTDGTFLSASAARRNVEGMVSIAKLEWQKRGCLRHFERVLRCVRQSRAIVSRCRCCSGVRLRLRGDCSRRDCILDCKNYPAKKARQYRAIIGDTEWLGHYVVSLPMEQSKHITVADTGDILRGVNKALLDLFYPIVPAGVSCLHWSGETNPRRKHVHVHSFWSGRAELSGEVVDAPGPMLSKGMLADLREATSDVLGVRVDRRNGHYSFREGERKIRHCIRYGTRQQGNGDPVALVRYTLPGAHTLKPFGMLGPGKRNGWIELVGAGRSLEELPGGSHPVQMKTGPEDHCKCGGKFFDPLTMLD